MTELQIHRACSQVLSVVCLVLMLGLLFVGRRLQAERELRKQTVENLEAALKSR